MCVIGPHSCVSASLRVNLTFSPSVGTLTLNDTLFGNILVLMPLFLHRKLKNWKEARINAHWI